MQMEKKGAINLEIKDLLSVIGMRHCIQIIKKLNTAHHVYT